MSPDASVSRGVQCFRKNPGLGHQSASVGGFCHGWYVKQRAGMWNRITQSHKSQFLNIFSSLSKPSRSEDSCLWWKVMGWVREVSESVIRLDLRPKNHLDMLFRWYSPLFSVGFLVDRMDAFWWTDNPPPVRWCAETNLNLRFKHCLDWFFIENVSKKDESCKWSSVKTLFFSSLSQLGGYHFKKFSVNALILPPCTPSMFYMWCWTVLHSHISIFFISPKPVTSCFVKSHACRMPQIWLQWGKASMPKAGWWPTTSSSKSSECTWGELLHCVANWGRGAPERCILEFSPLELGMLLALKGENLFFACR